MLRRGAKHHNGGTISPRIKNKFLLKCIMPIEFISTIFGLCPIFVRGQKIAVSYLLYSYSIAFIATITISPVALASTQEAEQELRILANYKEGFSFLFKFRFIVFPILCLFSFSRIVVLFGKHLIKVINESFLLASNISPIVLKRIFWQQLTLVALLLCGCCGKLGYFCHIHPSLFQGNIRYILTIIDHLLLAMVWTAKLQFLTLTILNREILIIINDNILKVASDNSLNAQSDLTVSVKAYKTVIKHMNTVQAAYGPIIGTGLLMTGLNAALFAYYYTLHGSFDWVLVLYNVGTLALEWILIRMVLSFINEVENIKLSVSEVLDTIQWTNIQRQLEHFTFYLLHQNISFTICGMVALDYSLMFAMGGAIFTNVIVLVQFGKSDVDGIPVTFSYVEERLPQEYTYYPINYTIPEEEVANN